jgi:tetratricopeptide (TPR) repeat protein
MRLNRIAQAIPDFTAAITANPNLAVAHQNRGISYFRTGRFDDALADFENAVRLEPNAERFQWRGSVHAVKGNMDQAWADINEALRGSPAPVLAAASYGARAEIHVLRMEFDEALQDYEAALQKNPMHFAAHFGRGNVFFLRGEYQRAITEFDAGLRVQGRSAPILYRRGVAKLKLGIAEGNADIEAAKAINPAIAEIAAREGVAP